MLTNSRAQAAKILFEVICDKKSLGKISAKDDAALIQEICYGSLRFYHRLDGLAKLLLKQPPQKNDQLVYVLIIIGLYQLIYMRIPDHAALSETVNAARALKKNWATGLINGVLRNFLRQKETLLPKLDAKLQTQYSHPEWLIKLLQKSWPENWREILIANNEHPPMHLRVNLTRITREEYAKKIFNFKFEEYGAAAIILAKPVDVKDLPGFSDGLVSVQDIAAQMAPKILELKPGLRVLDACAAPGGKTAHILESENNLAEVVALDIDAERVQKIADNLKRLQLTAKIICGDAVKPDAWWDGKKFDRILLDAPCSATGIIRRHPDIKVLRMASDIVKLAAKQLELLEALWPLLAEDGILVYATCSVLPEENSQVIMKFLQNHANAKKVFEQQFFPDNSHDGFYYAKIAIPR